MHWVGVWTDFHHVLKYQKHQYVYMVAAALSWEILELF